MKDEKTDDPKQAGNAAQLKARFQGEGYPTFKSVANGRAQADAMLTACLPIEEYNQTQGNLTEATETLWSTLTNRNIRLYNAPDLRQHVLNAVSVETPRGIRLSKQKTANKIDAAVALSFAVLAAIRAGKPPAHDDAGRNDDQAFKQTWDARFDWSYRN